MDEGRVQVFQGICVKQVGNGLFYHGDHGVFHGGHGDSLRESLCPPCVLRVLRGKRDGSKKSQFVTVCSVDPKRVLFRLRPCRRVVVLPPRVTLGLHPPGEKFRSQEFQTGFSIQYKSIVSGVNRSGYALRRFRGVLGRLPKSIERP